MPESKEKSTQKQVIAGKTEIEKGGMAKTRNEERKTRNSSPNITKGENPKRHGMEKNRGG